MPTKMKKQEFLLNKDNKQRSFCLLGGGLVERVDYTVNFARGDADLLIVKS